MATNWLCGILNSSTRRLLAGALVLIAARPGNAQPRVPSAASVAPASTIAPTQAAPVVGQPARASALPGNWQLLRTIQLPNPGPGSLDRRGTLYVADADNNLRQFTADGLPLNTFAPQLPGHVAQVEAWNMTTILLFSDDRQELVLLDRFLAPLTQLRLADYFDGTIRVATLASDNQIWLLDESNLVLRQFDPNALRQVKNTPLDLIIGRSKPDFRFLRYYQNNVYLVDRTSGIFVFDNLGNFKKKLPFTGLNTMGFLGDELYYTSGGELRFFHLYNLTERAVPLPAGTEATGVRQVLVDEGYAYVFTAAGVAVYKLQ